MSRHYFHIIGRTEDTEVGFTREGYAAWIFAQDMATSGRFQSVTVVDTLTGEETPICIR